jgi:hypothetical protein
MRNTEGFDIKGEKERRKKEKRTQTKKKMLIGFSVDAQVYPGRDRLLPRRGSQSARVGWPCLARRNRKGKAATNMTK